MMRIFSPDSSSIMFLPIPPRPPRGITRSWAVSVAVVGFDLLLHLCFSNCYIHLIHSISPLLEVNDIV